MDRVSSSQLRSRPIATHSQRTRGAHGHRETRGGPQQGRGWGHKSVRRDERSTLAMSRTTRTESVASRLPLRSPRFIACLRRRNRPDRRQRRAPGRTRSDASAARRRGFSTPRASLQVCTTVYDFVTVTGIERGAHAEFRRHRTRRRPPPRRVSPSKPDRVCRAAAPASQACATTSSSSTPSPFNTSVTSYGGFEERPRCPPPRSSKTRWSNGSTLA